MRKWNAIISIILIVLFLIHTIAGSFQLMKIIPGGNELMKQLSYLMLFLIAVHTFIGTKFTIDSILIGKKTGKFYFRENAVFWIRRMTGFAMILLIISHVLLFTSNTEVFRLNDFGKIQLVFSILLVFTLLIHIFANIRPLLIALGIAGTKAYMKDIFLVLSVILLISTVAFVIYYIRWNIGWRY
ncbi:MAG: pilus assembly protein PilX [Catonella sp.]|uniref:pilus assembly protein PilX n=1 Tax=Catonella sp. TaxID=2382125 RepID=UPI003FA0F452